MPILLIQLRHRLEPIPGVLEDLYHGLQDYESFQMARRIIKEEGLLIGGSSGGAVWAALQIAKKLQSHQNCLVVLPDSIRNYLSKFIDDEWLKKNNLD